MVAAMNSDVLQALHQSLQKISFASLLSHEEEKKGKLAEIKYVLDELIRKMDLEARSLQQSADAVCLFKLREYKADSDKNKADLKPVEERFQTNVVARCQPVYM
ncbi:unnamed protein product [Eruca vesicaria subsp. sativa]|uniref:Vesicle transport v-SNARE N-terminal domain-containing protein n=1 Tax=Eruca vesicaria subsp. sativa TaxID=29727 RepID=A0ABC8KK48_ERUVS|nr:unnamed protein product [Eruca vesicaria subsp. sativa]